MEQPNKETNFTAKEAELAHLAYLWRGASQKGNTAEANTLVQQYHASCAELWSLGWRGKGMLPDEELPDESMPDYYMAYWKSEQTKRT